MMLKKARIFHSAFTEYTATKIIGEGGSGTVYTAIDESGVTYALKLLDSSKATKEKVKRFKNELQFCERNVHPNIITVIDRGTYEQGGRRSPFYVMPLASGSLRDVMRSGIPTNQVLRYFNQAIDGVEAAHLLGVVHRDIKPENILYQETEDRLLIADFGIARFAEDEIYTAVETKDSTRLANFQYAAPEQRTRGIDVDHRADIYALGLILNEMFTGEVPQGTGYRTIANLTSQYLYLDELVSQMLRQSPADRPQTIDVLKQELRARGEEFAIRQKLSEQRQSVIPITELDDPLIVDPPRLIGFEWDGTDLVLQLSRSVTEGWARAFNRLGNYTANGGKRPSEFAFAGDQVMLRARERQVQPIIDDFKRWLPSVSKIYRENVEREARKAEEKQREDLLKRGALLEARQRVLKNIKI